MRDDDKLYSNLYSGAHYGRDDCRQFQSVLNVLTLTDKSIIDVGCGTGWLRNKIRHAGYIGIDIASIFKGKAKEWAPDEKFMHLDLRYPRPEEIPQADVAICMDVLEHIDEPVVDMVIRNTLKWGRETVFGIALFPNVIGGEILHVTLKSADWWRDKIKEQTEIAHEVRLDKYVLFFISDRDLTVQLKIPYSYQNMRIRRNDLDGSFSIARGHRECEKYLDGIGIRVPGTLNWFLPYDGPKFDFTKMCYIVGKGPSLDAIKASHFDGVSSVICINDSIHKIRSLGIKNPLFLCQQDIIFKDTCIFPDVTSILAPRVRPYVGNRPNVFYVHPRSVGHTAMTITSIYAMNLAQMMDVRHFIFVCFDACVIKKLGYAKCIKGDVEDGGSPERFLDHRLRINQAQRDSKIEWVIPIAQPSEASDILQQ